VAFTVIDPGKDIDILVLVPDHLLLVGYPRNFNLKSGADGVGLGGDCEFLVSPMEVAGNHRGQIQSILELKYGSGSLS